MRLQERIPLAPFTTLGVGGKARFFVEAQTEQDIDEAIAFAREHALPLFVLGKGSNVFVPDAGIAGVVVQVAMHDLTVEDEGETIVISGDAGARWDAVVDEAGARDVFGIENLAGIPGSLGGAAVQNIGAYGAELSSVFEYADVVNGATGERRRIMRAATAFAYRTSFFKEHPELIITRVAMRLLKNAQPNIAYPDIARAAAAGTPLTTPREIVRAIRAIRAKKFPRPLGGGTAGSFFKNPVVPSALAVVLTERFPDLPTFPQEDGTVKIPLAWILDHVLSLKGYTMGSVRLYEEQPLVMVARAGATAAEVDALAREVAARVQKATGIAIEREVETFGTRV